MRIFANDLRIPEAPVLLPDGSWLFTEMGAVRGCTTHISSDGKSRRIVAKTGRPSGLTLDRDGFIWVAETVMRALLKMSLDGRYEVFADSCNGERFILLNDLAFAPNGDLYLTDSGIELEEFAPGGKIDPNYKDKKYDGRVYRIDIKTGNVELVDHGLRFANGLAFGPDNNLYVAETLTGTIYRYKYMDGKVTGNREVFCNVLDTSGPEGMKGPDGFKFGMNGHLFAAVFGQGSIAEIDKDGKVVRRIKTEGIRPSNLAFGKPGERKIYVTEDETGTIQVFDVDTDGFPLFE